jgi:Fic family protein
LLFFMRGLLTEARDAARRAGPLFDLRESYQERFRKERASVNLLATVEHLFGRPVTDIREIEASLNISFEAARRLVNRLEGEGILEEITGRRRNRVYAAREIVRVLQGPIGEER